MITNRRLASTYKDFPNPFYPVPNRNQNDLEALKFEHHDLPDMNDNQLRAESLRCLLHLDAHPRAEWWLAERLDSIEAEQRRRRQPAPTGIRPVPRPQPQQPPPKRRAGVDIRRAGDGR